jgi:hypothetical protein
MLSTEYLAAWGVVDGCVSTGSTTKRAWTQLVCTVPQNHHR